MESVASIKSNGERLLNGTIYKCIKQTGSGAVVEKSSEVSLEFKLICNNVKIVEYTAENPFRRQLEQILPIGLRYIASTMTKGERVLAWIDPLVGYGRAGLMYGSESHQRVPPNTGLVVEVKLLNWQPMDFMRQPFNKRAKLTSESLTEVVQMAMDADELYNKGRKELAMRSFRLSLSKIRSLRSDASKEPEKERERRKTELEIILKTAQCAFDTARYPQAVTLGREALQIDEENTTAAFIIGCGYFALGYEKSAIRFVRQAHCRDINNPMYLRKLRDIERHQSLIEKNIDEEDDETEYQTFATILYDRMNSEKSIKKMTRAAQNYINKQLSQKIPLIYIGGGFEEHFLKKIAATLQESDRRFRTKLTSGVLEIIR